MPLPYIMILIIVSLILIFLYLVEPFITRQKIKDNNEHGSARWSTLGEIKRILEKKVFHILKKVVFLFTLVKIIKECGLIIKHLIGLYWVQQEVGKV